MNSNNTTTNIPLVSTNNSIPTTTTSTVTPPSLSTFSFGDVSPEVAQILAQAKGNLTSATANNLSTPTVTNTLLNPSTTITTATSTITNPVVTSIPNLPAPPNFLSAFLNAARNATNETTNGKKKEILTNRMNQNEFSFSTTTKSNR